MWLSIPPLAADYFDGGQHDCQELLRVLMDLLHEDLVSVLVWACCFGHA